MLIWELAPEYNENIGYKVSVQTEAGVKVFYYMVDAAAGRGVSRTHLGKLTTMSNSTVKIETRESQVITVWEPTLILPVLMIKSQAMSKYNLDQKALNQALCSGTPIETNQGKRIFTRGAYDAR
jgi:hypothetical protein